jgi:chaperonin cofactor prefoldin
MTEMENEYEALKNKINVFINRMDELDKEYVKVKKILNKRTKGRML